jgi:hypothetical protein
MKRRVLEVFRLLLGSCLAAAAFAQIPADQAAFFEKKIRPVLEESCYACHSAKRNPPKGGLRLDTREGLRKGGVSGPCIVPGDPANSLLIKAISYRDPDLRMPPNGSLADYEVADFTEWVKMGAPDPRPDSTAAAKKESAPAPPAFQHPFGGRDMRLGNVAGAVVHELSGSSGR